MTRPKVKPGLHRQRRTLTAYAKYFLLVRRPCPASLLDLGQFKGNPRVRRVIDVKKVVSEISGAVFSLPWMVAKDYGFFEAEGIDMEFVRAQTSGVVNPTENPDEVNPVLGHAAFEEARVSIYRA